MEYVLHILILIGIYIILSASLNLIAGYTGLISIAHAAFYGIGAYVAALLALKCSSPFLVNVIVSVIAGGVFGALIAIPSLRIRDDYFVIASFAFQVITFSILNNLVQLTGGPMGLPGIPQPEIFGFVISSHIGFVVLIGLACWLTLWMVRRIVKSPYGRVLSAIREDEVFAQSMGKNVAGFKVQVFMIGAALASLAGALYASYISFIDPTSFTVMESILIISIVIIGGAGSLWGPVLGGIVIVLLPELLRAIGLPGSVAANLRQILYGGLLIALMMWRPRGFLGQFAFYGGQAKK